MEWEARLQVKTPRSVARRSGGGSRQGPEGRNPTAAHGSDEQNGRARRRDAHQTVAAPTTRRRRVRTRMSPRHRPGEEGKRTGCRHWSTRRQERARATRRARPDAERRASLWRTTHEPHLDPTTSGSAPPRRMRVISSDENRSRASRDRRPPSMVTRSPGQQRVRRCVRPRSESTDTSRRCARGMPAERFRGRGRKAVRRTDRVGPGRGCRDGRRCLAARSCRPAVLAAEHADP